MHGRDCMPAPVREVAELVRLAGAHSRRALSRRQFGGVAAGPPRSPEVQVVLDLLRLEVFTPAL